MAGMSAIILAGDRRGSKLVRHENKAFLGFRGEPLFLHVLKALLSAKRVGRIVIIGPAKRIKDVLSKFGFGGQKLLSVIEQRENLLENTKAGFVASLGKGYSKKIFEDLRRSEHRDTAALFVPCDVPLITPWEIDDFIARTDSEHHEYTIGMTGEAAMEYYYPAEGKPGIRMVYYHLREGLLRHNNLHIGKPLKVDRLSYVESMYEARYQTKFFNMIKIYSTLVFNGRRVMSSLRCFGGLQMALTLYGMGAGWWYEHLRRGNSLRATMKCIGAIMGMKMQAVITEYGGATLDVDNARDLEIAEQMYDEWMAHQKEIYDRSA